MQGALCTKNAFAGVLCFLLSLNSIPQRFFSFVFLGVFLVGWLVWFGGSGFVCLFLFFVRMDRLTTMKKK